MTLTQLVEANLEKVRSFFANRYFGNISFNSKHEEETQVKLHLNVLTALYRDPLATKEQRKLMRDITRALPEQGIYWYRLPRTVASSLAKFGAMAPKHNSNDESFKRSAPSSAYEEEAIQMTKRLCP